MRTVPAVLIHTIATGNPHLSELEDEMTGSLTTKHGKYYVVVRVPDGTGGMKAKWIPTGISSEGNNKRKAQQKQLEILAELEHDKDLVSGDMPFSTWLEQWMEIKRSVVRQNTLECYRYYLDKHIKPYFDAKKLTLKAVTAQSIQDYYSLKLSEGQSANTICKHNVIIAGALREAKRKKV